MTSTPEHAGNAFSWRFTTPLFIGSALNPINSSVIATALVPIAAGVHVSVGETAILVTALYLASSVAQPTWGKLSEEFGPRRMFLAGIVLVLIGGVVGGAGRNLTTLVVARALIGIGTSAGYPSAMLLIRRRAASAGLDAPPGGVLGGLQISGMVTAAVGLPLGGVLVGAFGWRSTFLINIPVALVTLGMAARWLPRDAPVEGARSAREIAARIDVAGIAGFAAAMIALLTFLFSLQHPNWVALGLAAVLFGALIGWELRTRDPFIDMRLVASNLALTRTYLRFALTSLVIYTVLYGLAQWLEVGRGISAQEAGLLILPMSVLSAVIARPISQRNLVRSPLIAAAGSSLVASLGLLFLTTSTAIILIVAVTLVFGVTLGTMSVGNQTALYTQVTAEQIGTVSGLFRTFGYIGSVGSSAIIAIVFHRSVTDHGLHVIAVIMIAASAAVLLMTLADRGIMTLARAGEATPPPATQQPEQEKHQERTGDHALVRTRPARARPAPAHPREQTPGSANAAFRPGNGSAVTAAPSDRNPRHDHQGRRKMAPQTDPGTRWNVAVLLPEDQDLPAGLVSELSQNPPLNVSRMLAGTLDIYPSAAGLVEAIFEAKDVDVKLRQVIALRAAQLLDCRYEWEANVIFAKNAKITDDQIAIIGAQGPVTGLDKDANLLCRSTDEITLDGSISDDALTAMLDRFGATLTNKFILIISWFNLLSRYLLSTRVPLEKSNKLTGRTSPL